MNKENLYKSGANLGYIYLILMVVASLVISPTASSVGNPNSTKIYFDPQKYIFTTDDIKEGDLFNVTVKVSNVEELFSWQVRVWFNNTVLKATNAYYHPDDPISSGNHIPVDPIIENFPNETHRPGSTDYNETHGYVQRGVSAIFGSSYDGDFPICIIEFEVTKQPPEKGHVESVLFLNNPNTYLLDVDVAEIPCTKINGWYSYFVPFEFRISSPKRITYTTTSVPLEFTVDVNASWMGYSLDGGENVSITGNTTLDGLSEGGHSIVVFANDTAGNMDSSDIIYFKIDTEPPKMSIISPKNKKIKGLSVDLKFTVSESTSEISWMGYCLDGMGDVPVWVDGERVNATKVEGNTTLAGLSAGLHWLRVFANDTVGHMASSDIIYFTLYSQDVTVDYVTLPPFKQVDQGETVDIIILVRNCGVKTETFNVTVYYEENSIETQTVSYGRWLIGTRTVQLEADSEMFLPFQWDTTNVKLGSYTINATANPLPNETDIENNIFAYPRRINVTVYPTAHFAYSPMEVWVNETVWFDATLSTANYGSLTDYRWDFGDNSTINTTDPLVSHQYGSEGTYKITLTVENTLDNTERYTMNVTVQAHPPPAPPSWNVLAAMAVGVAMLGVAMFISVRYTKRRRTLGATW